MKERASIGRFPWHPILLGFFFVLAIYQTSSEHQPIGVVWAPLGISLVLVSVGLILGGLLARSIRSGALICFSLLSSLLLFPAFRSIGGGDWGTLAFFLLFAGQVGVFWRIGKSRRNSVGLTSALNLVTLCCLASVVFSIVSAGSGMRAKKMTPDRAFVEREVVLRPVSETSPDIIYIVLDGYARNDVLLDLYGFDNSAFTDRLKASGFYVSEQARANYCQTGLSMASALNADYFRLPDSQESSNDRSILQQLIQNSRVPAWLSDAGYRLKIYESGYYLTSGIQDAERIRTCSSNWNEFQHELVRKLTLWLPVQLRNDVMTVFGETTLMEQHRVRVRRAFEQLKEEPGSASEPTFVFIHILAPHPPFLFAEEKLREKSTLAYSLSDGNHLVDHLAEGKNEYRALYVSQLQWINQQVMDSLASLQTNGDRPKIIIIQSDHGAGSELNWDEIERSNPTERLGILNAVYFSEGYDVQLNPNLSPINTMRTLLNQTVLEEPMPLLREQSFLSSWSEPYRFLAQ